MIYFTCDIADISYLVDSKTVFISWKQDFDDANKYFLILSKAFVLLKDKGSVNWVSDLRRKRNLSIFETEWLRKYMLPQAIENNVKKIAFIINIEDEEAVRMHAILRATQNRLNLRFFYNEADVLEWITSRFSKLMV
jgi:hypothetical protein